MNFKILQFIIPDNSNNLYFEPVQFSGDIIIIIIKSRFQSGECYYDIELLDIVNIITSRGYLLYLFMYTVAEYVDET